MQEIEIKRGQPIEVVLRELYVERRLSLDAVAAEIGLASKGTLSRWMDQAGIEMRPAGRRPKGTGPVEI